MLKQTLRRTVEVPREVIQRQLARVQSTFELGPITTLVAAVVAVGIAYVVTLNAGGTHTVFPHLFYVPVLIVALRWGAKPGATAGIAAGVLFGPVMPLNTTDGIPQELGNGVTRMGFFVGIGMLSGAISGRMTHRHERIERLHSGAITALVRTIDAKSPYTARHSERVAHYAGITARALGMPKQTCEDIRWAGYVHDIGKLWVPDEVLNKAELLADDELELIKRHPVFSEQLLSDVDEFQPYLPAVRGHHERYDGRGYPDGLVDREIPLEAQILALADAFEAMTAERPYRPALTLAEALVEVEKNAGTQFGPELAPVFFRVLQSDAQLVPFQPSPFRSEMPAFRSVG